MTSNLNDIRSNTEQERQALALPFNLADGHCRITPPHIMKNCFYNSVENLFDGKLPPQHVSEVNFYSSFNRLFGMTKSNEFLLSYSVSSLAITVGFALRYKVNEIVYQNPFFDNMRDIILRCGNKIVDVFEGSLFSDPESYVPINGGLWLTLPNNPTGLMLSLDEICRIAKLCEERKCVLILDLSFRAFSISGRNLDIKRQLADFRNLSWIIFEDTGKMLPLADIKVGILECSQDFFGKMKVVNEEHLLNVSPAVLKILAMALDVFDIDSHIIDVVQENRMSLTSLKCWKELGADIAGSNESPFLWLKGPKGFGEICVDRLGRAGIGVLSGAKFFPKNFAHGDSYLRIALNRNRKEFLDAIQKIEETLSK